VPECIDRHALGPRVQVSKPLSDRHPLLATLRAWGRSVRARTRLPPGDLIDLGPAERAQRHLLLDRAARHGPVFKALMERRLVVCVVGNGLGRRLLRDHAAALRPVAIRIDSVVPAGFMRRMDGELHRRYRQALMRALLAPTPDADGAPFEAVAQQALARHAAAAAPQGWLHALADIAAGSLIVLFFGAAPGTSLHARLLAGFRRLGPHGVVWNLAARQVEAFHALCDDLQQTAVPGGVMARLQAQGELDATMLGNLIYMVELGRYDLRGLLRWIVRYAAEQPAWLDRIGAGGTDASAVAMAFVQETLRLEQSERLMRDVEQDIRFEGWLIPRGALLRVCLWEAHKDPQAFEQPFVFDPSRFIEPAQAGSDRFAPFGLDAHHCPLAGLSVRIAADFLRVLARDYVVRGQGAEPAVRGPYHWEPSPRFDVQLQRRALA
jgi:cytochrome P450